MNSVCLFSTRDGENVALCGYVKTIENNGPHVLKSLSLNFRTIIVDVLSVPLLSIISFI